MSCYMEQGPASHALCMRHAPLLALLLLTACGPALPGGSGGPGAPDCGDDAYGPNGSLEEAAATVDSGEWSWQDDDLVLCPDAEDWFAWEVVTDCAPAFHLSWDGALGDLDVQTFDDDGAVTGDLATDWDTGRTIAYGESEAGFTRVRRVDGGGEPLSYELIIEVDCLAR